MKDLLTRARELLREAASDWDFPIGWCGKRDIIIADIDAALKEKTMTNENETQDQVQSITACRRVEIIEEELAPIVRLLNKPNACMAAPEVMDVVRMAAERVQTILSGFAHELRLEHKRNKKQQRDEEQALKERDDAEEALSQAYYLVTGRSPEWSNCFGHKEALEEIDEAQRLLLNAATLSASPAGDATTKEKVHQVQIDRKFYHVTDGHTVGTAWIRAVAAISDDKDIWKVEPGAPDRKLTVISEFTVTHGGLRFYSTPAQINAGDAMAFEEYKAENERLRKALESTCAFIGVMYGSIDGKFPETIESPLRIPIKLGEIMRDAEAALSGGKEEKQQ